MHMPPQKLFDHQGRPLILTKEIGKGGEGTVWELQDHPDLVAKLYNKTLKPQQVEKISTMIRIGNQRLLNLAAWPIHSIHTGDHHLVGFTMVKLTDHRPIFELYSPKIRLQHFPKADWRFLIHAAINTARAFLVIHEAGHVIGDVNHGNIFVKSDATVQFIDTDSFQIHCAQQHWLCEVGVSTHQPPEMQNIPYNACMRTANHDNFGLAVLIFQLLCLGRHPFSGVYLESRDISIEKAIAEYRYAYSEHLHVTHMHPPPASLPMHALPLQVRRQFECAFSKEGTSSRPLPQDWIAALTELSTQLKQCRASKSHYYFLETQNCPWCAIEQASDTAVFPITDTYGHADIQCLWQEFLKIRGSLNLYPLPDVAQYTVSQSSTTRQVGKQLKTNQYRCAFALFLGLVMLSYIGSLAVIIALVLAPMLFLGMLLYDEHRLTKTLSIEWHFMKSQWESLCQQHEALIKNPQLELTCNKIEQLKNRYDHLMTGRMENRDLSRQRRIIMQELSRSISHLSILAKQTNKQLQNLHSQMYDILPRYAQALEDAKAAGMDLWNITP